MASESASSEADLASAPAPGGPALLEMRGMTRRFGATLALDAVDFALYPGEIHALLGENGAGKSTLMHLLSGLLSPDAGTISLEGRPVMLTSPRAARSRGIAMVHQHFALVPAFTVAENLALDDAGEGRKSRAMAESTARSLQRASALGWELPPHATVGSLSVGLQQRIEITKALASDARILIFDEPTAVLAGDEVEELFAVLRRLRAQGAAIALIAHKLSEILAVADRVTVLRRGRRVAGCPVAETDAAQLAAWMVGASLAPAQTGTRPPDSPTSDQKALPGPDFRANALTVLGERGDTAVRGLSLEVRAGEILAVGGVDGNGQVELAEALTGLRPVLSGSMTWQSRTCCPDFWPRTGYIPQDRRRSGLAVQMSVADNLLFLAVRDPAYRRGPLLRLRALRALAEELVRKFDVRTPSLDLRAAGLSGGNQQKLVVARALHGDPEWIVALNPTRGLDLGATRFVHEQLRQARARGAAVLVISTDLDELAALADRGAILSRGQLHPYDFHDLDRLQVGLLLGGENSAAV